MIQRFMEQLKVRGSAVKSASLPIIALVIMLTPPESEGTLSVRLTLICPLDRIIRAQQPASAAVPKLTRSIVQQPKRTR